MWQTFLSRPESSRLCRTFYSEMEEQRNAVLFSHSDDLQRQQTRVEHGRQKNAATIQFTSTVRYQEYRHDLLVAVG